MIHYCQLKPKPYLGLLSLRPVSSFPCQGPIENHVTLTWRASLGPTWLWAPHTFFLTVLRSLVICLIGCPQLGLVSCFLMIKPRLWVFGRRTAGIKCPSQPIVPRSTASAGPSLLLTATTGLSHASSPATSPSRTHSVLSGRRSSHQPAFEGRTLPP